jgi:Ca-activated chloride channel homolog
MSNAYDKNSNPPASSNASFPEWMLTAYALGELDASDSDRVEQSIKTQPSLQLELDSIRQMLGKIESTYKTNERTELASSVEQAVKLSAAQEEIVHRAMEQSTRVEMRVVPKPPLLANRRRLVALLATAATVPVGLLVWSSFQQSRMGSNDLAMSSSKQDVVLSDAPVTVGTEQLRSKDLDADLAGSVSTEKSADPLVSNLASAVNSEVNGPMPLGSTIAGTRANTPDGDKPSDTVDHFAKELSAVPAPSRSMPPAGRPDASKMRMDSTRSGLAVGTGGEGGGFGGGFGGAEGGYGMGQGGMGGPGGMQPESKTDGLAYGGGGYGAGGYGAGGYGAGSGGMGGVGGDGGYGFGSEAKPGFQPSTERGSTGTVPKTRGRAIEGTDSGRDTEAARVLSKTSVAQDRLGDSASSKWNESASNLGRSLPDELKRNLRDRFEMQSADRFDPIFEKPFTLANDQSITTFSVDVDTASYSKIRQTIDQSGQLPSPAMVRIEEMINSFEYKYPSPNDGSPFSASMKIAPCPWNAKHQLVRIGVQAKRMEAAERPRCNLVFLIDVSGSMNEPNKLPLVQRSLSMLTSSLRAEDRVSIVVYAGAAGCVLESTSGRERARIQSAIENLQAGGSTNGGQGIQLAYAIARENFVPGGANRVILCTDGDFNVGVTGTEQLVEMMKENAKSNVYLTCLGYGMGNYNDSMMEKISKDGNGYYGMVDNDREAKRLMIEQLNGTLVTVAKDVKLQVDFNPEFVRAYRIIGYEDRQLANADFRNDKKDAGDIGAGHSVTAFYEIVPVSLSEPNMSPIDEQSKYARKAAPTSASSLAQPPISEWLNLKIRSKKPEASVSTEQEFALPYRSTMSDERLVNDEDLAWGTSVAEFGLLLRRSTMAPDANWDRMIERATQAMGNNEHRQECVTLMRRAKALSGATEGR